jgi:hypothetical protein
MTPLRGFPRGDQQPCDFFQYHAAGQVAAVVEGWLSLLLDRLPWLQWHLPFVHSLAAAWDATHPGVPRMTVHHGATGAHYIEKLLRLVSLGQQGAGSRVDTTVLSFVSIEKGFKPFS